MTTNKQHKIMLDKLYAENLLLKSELTEAKKDYMRGVQDGIKQALVDMNAEALAADNEKRCEELEKCQDKVEELKAELAETRQLLKDYGRSLGGGKMTDKLPNIFNSLSEAYVEIDRLKAELAETQYHLDFVRMLRGEEPIIQAPGQVQKITKLTNKYITTDYGELYISWNDGEPDVRLDDLFPTGSISSSISDKEEVFGDWIISVTFIKKED